MAANVYCLNNNTTSELYPQMIICIDNISTVAFRYIELLNAGELVYGERKSSQILSYNFVQNYVPETMKSFSSRFYDLHKSLYPKMKIALWGDGNVACEILKYIIPAGNEMSMEILLNKEEVINLVCKLISSGNQELISIGKIITRVIGEIYGFHMPEKIEFIPRIITLGPVSPKFNNDQWGKTYVDIYNEDLVGDMKNKMELFVNNLSRLYGMSWGTFCDHMSKRSSTEEVFDIFDLIELPFEVMTDSFTLEYMQKRLVCKKFIEPLSTAYGYAIPSIFDDKMSDFKSNYINVMDSATNYVDDTITDRSLYQYVIPMGYLQRAMFKMTLKDVYSLKAGMTNQVDSKELFNVCEQMYKISNDIYPDLAQWLIK